jgi:Pyruvate/2-oxoacid:ferredoxin oxidoreductase gamma subunit
VSIENITNELASKFAGKFPKEVTAKNIKAVERAYAEVL